VRESGLWFGSRKIAEACQLFDNCPVCASPFTAFVRTVPTIRTKKDLNLYTCLECQSFWNPSGYREDARVLEFDYQWGLSVAERNTAATRELFTILASHGVKPNSVADIGCGIGTFLKTAKDMGKRVVGFDVNAKAIEHAVETNGLEAYAAMWSSNTPTMPIDLYVSIMVLEHIEAPRDLIKNLCEAAIRNDAALFISVPFMHRNRWHNILDPDPAIPGTVFFDNDVHVIHYSAEGLTKAMHEFGATNTQFLRGGLWDGILHIPERFKEVVALSF